MAAKRVEFHEEAGRETFAALEWYLERSERIAKQFLEEIEHAVRSVAEAPKRWPEYVSGTRRFVLHQFPFVIIYKESFRDSDRGCSHTPAVGRDIGKAAPNTSRKSAAGDGADDHEGLGAGGDFGRERSVG